MTKLELHIIKMSISGCTQDPMFFILVTVGVLMFLNVMNNLSTFQNICEMIGCVSI